MPKQNRVTPSSDIIATQARGLFTGNRGCLHDSFGRIRRTHRGTRWIICELDFKDRRRVLMRPGHYTELFFLDEATALAAGHRPCVECRRKAYQAFLASIASSAPDLPPNADALDRILHEQRMTGPWRARLGELPDGTFVKLTDSGPSFLLRSDFLLEWSPAGYTRRIPQPRGAVMVLTPPLTVSALAAGYAPVIHASA